MVIDTKSFAIRIISDTQKTAFQTSQRRYGKTPMEKEKK